MLQCSRLHAKGFLYCFVFLFIKFSSLMTEKSFCSYTDHWKSSSFVWSQPLAEFLIYMLSLISFSRDVFYIDSKWWSLMRDLSNCSLLVALCLIIKLLNFIWCSKPQMEAYVFFHNWKSIGCIHSLWPM